MQESFFFLDQVNFDSANYNCPVKSPLYLNIESTFIWHVLSKVAIWLERWACNLRIIDFILIMGGHFVYTCETPISSHNQGVKRVPG